MIEFDEHPSKVAGWREGRAVVLPEADQADCTAWVSAEADTSGSLKWEGLLARRISEERARICAVPFWVYDLNLGDEVALMESAERSPIVVGVVKDAGNYTFRVSFDDAPDDDMRWHELTVAMEPFDGWVDIRNPGFLAVSAPPGKAQAVADYLDARERRGELSFETGRSRPAGG